MLQKLISTLLPVSLLAVACGGEDPPTNTDQRPIQCRSADYVAFDAANHANQALRVGAYHQMLTLMDAVTSADPFSPTLAATNFAQARALYEETASLRAKVMERTDDHFADKPTVGIELDTEIMAALAAGEAATDAVAAAIAKQTVDKTLIHFFYLSVYHELVLGERAKWDEAFGYYGAPSDNAEGGRKGLALVASKRDATNNTTLAAEVFNGLIDGACALTEALDAAGTESVDYAAVPGVKAAVEAIDAQLQLTLAFSAGHEAFALVELQEELAATPSDAVRAEMWVALAELDPYFAPLERLMMRAGGESATRAAAIRAALDAAWASQNQEWMTTFDAAAVIQMLQAEYGIEIKG